jgi:hypothetical protein
MFGYSLKQFNWCAKLLLISIIASILVSNVGCGYYPKPRLRLGAYFGAPVGIAYPDPNNLGKHDYYNWWDEKIGLVYTSKGGFIDIGHLRDSADRTAYCTLTTYQHLLKGDTEFSFSLLEPSKYIVTIKYPDYWDKMPDKEKIAQEVAIAAGQYFTYNAMVWHEIITWYGYKYTGIFSEYISSFSWEDIYSDIIGIDIAGRALKQSTDNFDEVMTKLIYDELRYLDAQPVSTAKKAEQKIKGKWYNGSIYPFSKLKKRNLDIGLDDGYVTPWLVPGICRNTKPLPYAVPNLSVPKQYGFSIDVKIEPKIMEEHKLFKAVNPNTDGKYIVPSRDFPKLMKDITKKEIKRNGPLVNMPTL